MPERVKEAIRGAHPPSAALRTRLAIHQLDQRHDGIVSPQLDFKERDKKDQLYMIVISTVKN